MADIIDISTADEWMAFAASGQTGSADELLQINITNDLDFAEVDNFVGITNVYAYVEGNGHTIRNIVLSSSSTWYLMTANTGSTLSNLRFENCNISATVNSSITLFNGWSYVSNVIWGNTNTVIAANTINVFANSNAKSGAIYNKIAICGTFIALYFYGISLGQGYYRYGDIRNCYITANITLTGSNTGTVGLFGALTVYNSFSKSTVSGSASGYYYFAATSANSVPITIFCYNADTITGFSTVYAINKNYTSSSYAISSFYNSDTITNAIDSTLGVTTENLKSAEWLRSQHWAI
jgi:hypothetical protein